MMLPYQRHTRSGRARAGFAALVTAAALTLMPVSPATAHNVLVGTTPEDGSAVDAQPGIVELVFDDTVQDQFNQVAVLDAEENTYQTGDPAVDENVVTQAVDDLPDGDYTVSYRVVSADGHPVSGTFEFTMAAGGSGTTDGTGDAPTTEASPSEEAAATPAEAGPSDSDDATPAATTDSGGGITGTTVGGLVIVAVLAGLGLLTIRNRQRLRHTPGFGADRDQGDGTTP